jgi:hypothetical protein
MRIKSLAEINAEFRFEESAGVTAQRAPPFAPVNPYPARPVQRGAGEGFAGN